MRLDIVLILLEQLELVAKVSLLDHLRGDLAGIVSIWDGAETAADGPDVFHGVEDALGATAGAVRTGGHLVFETRDPARRAWEGWTPDATRTHLELPDGETVDEWCEVIDVEGEVVEPAKAGR